MKKFHSQIFVLAMLLFLSGCGFFQSEGEKAMRDMVEAINDLQETLHSIQDVASAQSAVGNLDAKYQRFIDDIDKLSNHLHDKALETTIKDLTQQCLTALEKLNSERERLRKVHGLPCEFWKIVQTRNADVLISFTEMVQKGNPAMGGESLSGVYEVQELWKKCGFENVMFVEVENLPSDLSAKAIERMKKTAPDAKATQINFQDKHILAMGPVKDYKAFLASIDFGNVTFEDEGQRSIHVTVDRTKLGARANSDAEEAQLRMKEAQEESEKSRKEIEQHQAQAAMEMASHAMERNMKEEGPDPSDPNYFEKLADMLAGNDHFAQQKAIDLLLDATPSQVEAPETRKKIAKYFKKIAESDDHFNSKKAIKGLVIWGGKYSVPILLKLLDQAHRFDKEDIIRALGELKDPQAAEAVTAYLGEFHSREAAFAALKQMGPAAEDALIAAAPSDNADVCLPCINLLGDVGTDKSLPLLREAQNSKNPDVRGAAKAAMKKIVARKNKAKAAAP
jgi:hypothetical protein